MTRQNAVIQCEFCARILGELEGLILLGIVARQRADRARLQLASALIVPFNEKVASKSTISSKSGEQTVKIFAGRVARKIPPPVIARIDTVASYTSESGEHTNAALDTDHKLRQSAVLESLRSTKLNKIRSLTQFVSKPTFSSLALTSAGKHSLCKPMLSEMNCRMYRTRHACC